MNEKKCKYSENIVRKSLSTNNKAENYALALQQMYSDVDFVPHFNDEEVLLEDWGISFFYKDTQDEIKWVILLALSTFINHTGYKVSHVLTDQKFKDFAIIQENSCLGIRKGILSDGVSLKIIEVENEL